jgi:hypothetical protein
MAAAARQAPLLVRVGVHGGTAHVGNMGCDSRLSYTAVGDVVNTASRLEGFVKRMRGPCDIIAGTAVVLQAHPAIAARYVGAVRLVGKTEAVRVCQVLGAAQLTAQERRAVTDKAERTAVRRAVASATMSDSAQIAVPVPSFSSSYRASLQSRGSADDSEEAPEVLTDFSQSGQPHARGRHFSASHVSVHYSDLPQELGGDVDDAVALFAARASGVCDGINYPALVTLGRLDKAVRRVHHTAHLSLLAARSAEAAAPRTNNAMKHGRRAASSGAVSEQTSRISSDAPRGSLAHERRRHHHRRRISGNGDASDGPESRSHTESRRRYRQHRSAEVVESATAASSSIAQLEAAARAIYQTLPWQLRQRFDIDAAFLPSRSVTGVYE